LKEKGYQISPSKNKSVGIESHISEGNRNFFPFLE